MRNLIMLAVFLVGVFGLIFWLWSDKPAQDVTSEFVALETTTEAPARPRADSDATLNEVEISVDGDGLVLDRLYGKQLDLLVTRNEVKDVAVLDGILTFSELEEGNWNFKAINLERYIEAYLK